MANIANAAPAARAADRPRISPPSSIPSFLLGGDHRPLRKTKRPAHGLAAGPDGLPDYGVRRSAGDDPVSNVTAPMWGPSSPARSIGSTIGPYSHSLPRPHTGEGTVDFFLERRTAGLRRDHRVVTIRRVVIGRRAAIGGGRRRLRVRVLVVAVDDGRESGRGACRHTEVVVEITIAGAADAALADAAVMDDRRGLRLREGAPGGRCRQ